MLSIRDQEQGYRRGLVLGLTMAEIAVLVIFILLLVLGSLFARQTRETDALRQQIATLEASATELDRISQIIGGSPEEIVRELARANDTRQRLVLVEQEIKRLTKLEEELEAARPDGVPKRPLPEVFREIVLLRDAVTNAGIAPTPSSVRQVIAEATTAEETLSALTEQNEQLARANEGLNAQLTVVQHQARSGGRGLDHPPCWATPEGKAEYILDIALTSQGLIMRDRELPHRARERAELPLAHFSLGDELTPNRFLTMTEPLFRWSVDHDCRFVVRAFDSTGSAEKAIYKRHMRVLEQRFYKYEELNENF